MRLEVIELRRAGEQDRYWRKPFNHDSRFMKERWWHGQAPMSDASWYVSALLDGEEVARAELNEDVGLDSYDTGSLLSPRKLQLTLLEVCTAHRRRGIATHLVGQIAGMYSGRQLLALSEDADEFWASLGWDRVDRVEGLMRFQPLFISPRPRQDQAPAR